MKRIKSEKGAITIIVLVSMLFFVAFLVSTYVVVANKVQSQKETIEETKRIYEPKQTMAEVYNSYFGTGEIIPIYTEEQLLAMGSGDNINVNGKIYTFSDTAQTAYVLMNDIEFNAFDIGHDYYWEPIGDRNNILYNFEGNNYKITVNYIDNQNEEYSIEYSKENEFSEPEYEIRTAVTFDDSVKEEAQIYVNNTAQGTQGEATVRIKRLNTVEVSNNLTDDTRTIKIENPNKIENVYELKLDAYNFIINITPSNARVTINGKTGNTYAAYEGELINWATNKDYYYSQSGTYTMGANDHQENITLSEKPSSTITLNPSSATPSTTGSFKSAASNANKGVDASTGTYARATGNAYLQWNFTNFSNVDNNARIDAIIVYYRIAAAWSMGASIEIKAGSKTCLSKTYNSVYSNLISGSQKYTETITSLPTASQLKDGFTVKVTKGNTSDSYHFRWYGATIDVTYTNP